MHRRIAALVFSAVLAFAGAARADEQGELDKGKNAYLARQYDEADARFRAMLDPRTGTIHDPVLVTQAYMLWGAVMVAKGKPQEASSLFEQLLLKDPRFEPDPLSFPTEVLDAFSDTKNRIRQRLNQAAQDAARREADRRAREEQEKRRQAARLTLLERLASEETVTEEHSRWIAWVPFGAGQFQNGETALGWLFLGSEAAFVLGGTLTLPFYYAERRAVTDAYNDPTGCVGGQDQYLFNCKRDENARSHQNTANALRVANLSLYGAFAFTAIVGVIEANLRYEPRVVLTKKRALPPALSWTPALTPLFTPEGRVAGGNIGVTVHF